VGSFFLRLRKAGAGWWTEGRQEELMAVQAQVLMPMANTTALAAALAIGMVVVGALLIGDVLDRVARRRRQRLK
jgi:hypothetical protein